MNVQQEMHIWQSPACARFPTGVSPSFCLLLQSIKWKVVTVDFVKKIKDKIIWDFRLENEFKNRQMGYAFVIDVCDQTPQLAIYVIKKHVSKTQPLLDQPPREMLTRAVEEQGGSMNYETLYNINDEIRQWLKQKYFS